MDGIALLRSQQADFIKRFQTGHLLHCELTGHHSELTVISGEKLRQLRDFCWDMAEKYKRTSSVRTVFINNLKGKLGEEAIRARLGDRITEVDYERKVGGDGKIDFGLTSNPHIGIQVKVRRGSLDEVQWQFTSEEIEKNAVLVCVLLQEQVSEAQNQYHLISAGFLATDLIETEDEVSRFTIQDLLYNGGLTSYLEIFENRRNYMENYPNLVEFSNLELWNQAIAEMQPKTFNFLFKKYCRLIHFDRRENTAVIEVYNQSLFKLAQKKIGIATVAFEKVAHRPVQIELQVSPSHYSHYSNDS